MQVAQKGPEPASHTWHGIVQDTLKANDIKLVAYVPDRC